MDPAKLKVEWEDIEKVWLTAAELTSLEKALLPANLVQVRDAFLFCCYTGLRYSDLAALHEGNVSRPAITIQVKVIIRPALYRLSNPEKKLSVSA